MTQPDAEAIMREYAQFSLRVVTGTGVTVFDHLAKHWGITSPQALARVTDAQRFLAGDSQSMYGRRRW